MRDQFEIAGGSVAGRDHAAAGRNNQDAFAWHQDERCTIAVVADGCSEGAHSEVGAQLGARLLVRAIENRFLEYATNPYDETKREPADVPEFWDEVRQAFLTDLIGTLMPSMANLVVKGDRIILDYFLFTVVGALITERFAYVFSIGDGVVALNGEVKTLGPFPGNAPPYAAYVAMAPGPAMEKRTAFRLRPPILIEGVQSILLGTDGVVDLIAVSDRKIPGKDELVGPLAQFWTDDRFFRNPDMVRRRLTLINRESVRVCVPRSQTGEVGEHSALVREPGLLRDDTTLATIRRRSSPSRSPSTPGVEGEKEKEFLPLPSGGGGRGGGAARNGGVS